jgi:hypothetical protein
MITLPTKIENIYKHIKQLEPKELKIRKKIDIFIATSQDDSLTLILHTEQKSRLLQKDVDKFEEIYTIVKQYIQQDINTKIVCIDSPLCSKAKLKFENINWTVLH